MMDRETLLQRRAEYQAALDQHARDMNALGGAIQDVDYWLSVLDKAEHGEAATAVPKEAYDGE